MITRMAKSQQNEGDVSAARGFLARSPSPRLFLWPCGLQQEQGKAVPWSVLVSALSLGSCCLKRGSGGSSLAGAVMAAAERFSCGSRGGKDLPKIDLTSFESICWSVFQLHRWAGGWVEIQELLAALWEGCQISLSLSPSTPEEWQMTDHKKVVSI